MEPMGTMGMLIITKGFVASSSSWQDPYHEKFNGTMVPVTNHRFAYSLAGGLSTILANEAKL